MSVERIDRFLVQGELARGGMGIVYRGVDPVDHSPVAIKVIRGGEESPTRRSRFQREAEALLKLDHPHVVTVRAVGLHGLHPYLVMDLVPGSSLEERLRREGPLGNTEAALLVRDLAGAVAHMHGHGLLHRDLKPDNVLLAGDRPLLTDFGLVLDLADDQQRLTQTGAAMGTPGYWPPELAMGRKDQVGTCSDIYGLGALLYACLTGRAPIQATTVQQMASDTAEGRIPPPRSLRPEVDRELERICLRALALDPADRHGNASELIEDLERWTVGGPGSSSTGLPAATRTVGTLAVAIVAVGLVGAGVLLLRQPDSEPAVSPSPLASIASIATASAGDEPVVAEVVVAEEVEQRIDESTLPGWSRGLLNGRRIRLRQLWSDGPGYLTYAGKALTIAGGALVSVAYPGSSPPMPGIESLLTGVGPVRVWDVATGRERLRLDTGSGRFEILASTADGTLLAIASRTEVQLWDALTWQRRTVLPHPGGRRPVHAMSFSPSGALLAVSGWWSKQAEPPVQVWDVATGQLAHSVPGPASYVAFRGETQLVLAGRFSGMVSLWDLERAAQVFEGQNGSMLDLAVADDGRHALTHSWDRSAVTVWDLEQHEIAREIVCPDSPSQILPGTGEKVFAVGVSGTVQEVDWVKGELLRTSPRPPGNVFAASLLPDGQVVTVGNVGRLHRLGLDLQFAPWPDPPEHDGPVLAASLHEGVRRAISPGGIWGWDDDGAGALQGAFPSAVVLAAVSSDGRYMVFSQGNGAAVIDLAAGAISGRCGSTGDDLVTLGVAAGGRHVLASTGTGRARLPNKLFHVRIGTGDEQARWIPLTDGQTPLETRVVTFTPDGTRGFSGHDDGTVRSWDLLEDTLLRRFPLQTPEGAPPGPPSVLALAATPTTLIAGDASGAVRRWRLTDGQPLPLLTPPNAQRDSVVSLASLDDAASLLFVAHESGALRLWDATAPRELDHVQLDGDFARSITLSPDRRHALVGTQRGHLVELALD